MKLPAPVTVVVPCYRCVRNVARAVRSAFDQTYQPLELIAVDDASDDGTTEALEALQRDLGADWLRVIRFGKNLGPGAARNAGWDAARGDYVAFLDADDIWLPRKIELQLPFMRAHPEFVATGHRAQYGQPGEIVKPATDAKQTYREISRFWILLKNPMVTPSLMVKRECKLRFHAQGRHMEDHRLLQDLIFAGARIARLDETLALIPKRAFGEGGLSADLWGMEHAELGNYLALRQAGHIGSIAYRVLVLYSLGKFARRLAIVRLRALLAKEDEMK